ncbi:unnamed protein product [Didymodactylos carnosus]|uniref:Pyrrolo-quinoline quinone repeat domain-containing protein n=1 Tax=Didymodactylos carnosus TaxID=1234261 RepID=A0A815H2D3_9BILA|nr:unnamed protein product [Didymodactylos carnosus]CAF4216184.1 unnamed protein product [Didymodactylos carnosus]
MIILGLTDVSITLYKPGNGSHVIAFDRFTGVLLWQNRVSSHPTSRLTSAPQLANNMLFIGISSIEEGLASDPKYPCCTFQGSVIALNASTGTFLWETKMMPDNNGTTTGYAGASIWGSQFPVDYKRNQIYVTTGNFYTLPALIEKCVTETSNLTLYSDPCDQPGAYGQAVVALDMTTGIVRWGRNLGFMNAFNKACSSVSNVNYPCPPNPGNDSDFGQAPILKLNLRYKLGGKNRDQLFVGQKCGMAFGFDAETGTIIWSNQVAPGAHGGGIKFGSAADDRYLYVGNNNADRLNYTLPNGTITTKASWSALDLVTGDIKWTTVDPTTNISQTSADLALTVWDQLVLVQGGIYPGTRDISIKGCLYGLNNTNGEVLILYVTIGYAIPRAATDGVVALQLPLIP